MEEATKVAKAEGVAVNQLINVAVAEKVSALRTEEYFAERAARGDIKKAFQVLKRAGKGNAPVAGDELPQKATRRRPPLQLAFPLQGSAKRLTWFDVYERNRQSCASIFRTLSGVVHLDSRVRVARESCVQGAVGAAKDVHGVHPGDCNDS